MIKKALYVFTRRFLWEVAIVVLNVVVFKATIWQNLIILIPINILVVWALKGEWELAVESGRKND